MTNNRLRDLLADAAEAAWKNGGLPNHVDSQAWSGMSDDEVVMSWLQALWSALDSAQDLLEDQVAECGTGTADNESWRASLLHLAALQVFLGSFINSNKTDPAASRPCGSVDEIVEGLAAALREAKYRYMQGVDVDCE
jgi:hypothetical protein